MTDRYQIFVWGVMILFVAVIVIVLTDSIAAAMIDGSKWFAVVMMVVFSIGGLAAFLVFWKDML